MSFLNKLFHTNKALPKNTLSSTMSFLFGSSMAGQTMTERTAMQNTAVYACDQVLAEGLDEEAAHMESNTQFGQISLSAHKLGTLIKVSEELLNDYAFDLMTYLSDEFSRRLGNAEEKAYLKLDNTVEDDLITKLIGSATATVENVLRQPLSAFDPLPDDI